MRAPRVHGLDDHQTQFIKLTHAAGYKHRPHVIFRDFCEIAALTLSNAVDRLQYEQREARYLEIVKGYTREELDRFAQMFACVVESLEWSYRDCLGEIFMGLDLGNHWRGQFFTPYNLSSMMARMTLNDVDQAWLDRHGGILTVCEPAVGAGGMVIAAAEALREKGVNYQQCMHVTAQDIDATAVHMTYIQLSLLHVPAVVLRGNTLTCEVNEHWVTPAHVMGLWDIRLRRRARTAFQTPPAAEASPEPTEGAPAAKPQDLGDRRDAIVSDRVRKSGQMDLF